MPRGWPWEDWWVDVWQSNRPPWRRQWRPPSPDTAKLQMSEFQSPHANPYWPFGGLKQMDKLRKRRTYQPWEMPPFAYRDWVRGVWLERAKRMERPGVRSKKADVSNAGGHEVHVTDPFENAVLPEKALTEWRVDPRLRTPSEMWVEILSEDHLKAGKLFAGTWDQKGIESKMQEAGISWRWFEREMVENRDFYRYILRMRAQKMGSLLLNLDAEVIRRMNDVGLENMEGKDLDRVYGVIEKATNMAERMVRRDEKEYEKLQQLNERKTGVEDAKFVEIPEDDAKRLDEARKELKGEDG